MCRYPAQKPSYGNVLIVDLDNTIPIVCLLYVFKQYECKIYINIDVKIYRSVEEINDYII